MDLPVPSRGEQLELLGLPLLAQLDGAGVTDPNKHILLLVVDGSGVTGKTRRWQRAGWAFAGVVVLRTTGEDGPELEEWLVHD